MRLLKNVANYINLKDISSSNKASFVVYTVRHKFLTVENFDESGLGKV